MDIYKPAKRSAIMRRVQARNTRPEVRVRQALHRLGFRFRLRRDDLPGKPDVVLPKHRIAILVHGCFWHGHSCSHGRRPSSNSLFWEQKLSANERRDERVEADLRSLGWKVIVIWECETKNSSILDETITRWLGSSNRPAQSIRDCTQSTCRSRKTDERGG